MSSITISREPDRVLIGFDRPAVHNAISAAMVEELHAFLDAETTTPSVLIFHSTTPGVFMSGADIAELKERRADDALRRINGALFDRIAARRWPTIAVIDGPALGGGCEFALACDFRIASTSARFAQPETRLGIIAAAGGNFRLERLVGLSLARRMLLAGESVSAEAALQVGLVDSVVSPSELAEAARDLAERIARGSWQALELTKLAFIVAAPSSTAAFDAAAQAVLFESDEKERRMSDFLRDREDKKRKGRP